MKEIKEQKTIYVTKYQASDGKVFEYRSDCEDYEKRLRGERKECPHCHGKGYFSQGWHQVFNEMAVRYESVEYTETCKHCGGKGYLDKKEVWG